MNILNNIKLFLIFILLNIYSYAQEVIYSGNIYGENFRIEHIASGLRSPWGIDFIDENRPIVTQKNGDIVSIDLKTKEIKIYQTMLDIYKYGQAGILDIAVSPEYNTDRTIYITYVKNINAKGTVTLAKLKIINNNTLEHEDILTTISSSNTNRHFGSRIAFDNKNNIFFSIGDRGIRANGQDLKNHSGSILRLDMDGKIPQENPFYNDSQALDEIWSYGHRNPQGLFYDKQRNILWSVEHGPRGGDEINIIKKGANYGWPIISYGKEYHNNDSVGEGTHKDGMEQPVKVYIPSIAPSSLISYSGKVFKKWKGLLFIGALKLKHINIVQVNRNLKAVNEKRIAGFLNKRIRDIYESPKGLIYFISDSGDMYRIIPFNKGD